MLKHLWILAAAALLFGCNLPNPGATASPAALTSTPAPTQPAVLGPEPSYKVGTFYYPWYGGPKFHVQWIHWEQNNHNPPQDIGSDFYPALGAYSSDDPAVVAQHMAWLRQAGIGVIIVSWWGPGSSDERPVPLILDTAAKYGIKVAFHIEPYPGRTAERLVQDIKYLYQHYGSSPAFFRSSAASTYSPGNQAKGMFFVWCIGYAGNCGQGQQVDGAYWQTAMDAIHALPEGALVIANSTDGSWVTAGHFDGLYNYATLHLDTEGGFNWARTLPPGALYVPSVIPGNSAQRVAYPPETTVPRDDGKTYAEQWTQALGAGVQPDMITITSFNEWHEGTMIEPIAVGANDGRGYNYADFGSLPPDGYLTLTREWIDKWGSAPPASSVHSRIQIKTTSDWTTVSAIKGGQWLRPQLVSASSTATQAGFESGDSFVLMQSLDDANRGKEVEMTWDLDFAGLAPGGALSLQIDRGNIGHTQVTVYNYLGSTPVSIKVINWGGVTSGRNSDVVTIAADKLLNPAP